MKKIIACLLMTVCLLLVGGAALAAGASENRRFGYFDNTRTVILLPVACRSSSYAAAYLDREMKGIFKYPYYRVLPTYSYAGEAVTPDRLEQISAETGADIVVLPQVTDWTRWVSRRSLFRDADDVVYTRVVIDVYSYRRGDAQIRDDQAYYSETEEEGFVRDRYIMDEVMKRLYKKFPYRRVPTDISKNLSGAVTNGTAPKADMNK
ncbi:MAG: hypothetical protein SPI25_06445 [Dialister sp.]|nr:hypothetical protein [Dialister sp.]